MRSPTHLATAALLAVLPLGVACNSVTPLEPDATAIDASGNPDPADAATDAMVTFDANPSFDAEPSFDATPPIDGAVCGAGSTCVAPAPGSWNGPVVVHEGTPGTPAPACPAGYPTRDHDLLGDIDAGGSCSCSCGDAQGVDCSPARIVISSHSQCLTVSSSHTLVEGQCGANPGGSRHRVQAPSPSGGSCQPTTTDNLATPTWQTSVRTCSSSALTAGGCSGDQLCAPNLDAAYDKMCIWVEGDSACPVTSPYTERTVRYSGFNDGRSCDTCSCDTPTGTCGGSVQYTNSCTFPAVLYSTISAGSCGTYDNRGTQVTYRANPEVACAASAPSVSGSVETTGAVTFCCMP